MPDDRKPQLSEDDYTATLRKLEKHGSDGFGMLGQAALTGLGVAAGIGGAGTVAAAIGVAPTLLGSAGLAAMVGMTTPVGWVAAIAGAAGALAYGLGRIIRGGGVQDERLRRRREDLRDKIREARKAAEHRQASDQMKLVADILHTAHVQGKIAQADGESLIGMLKDGRITPQYALETLKNLQAIP